MTNQKYIEIHQDNMVSKIHHMPFHEKHGAGKTEEELLSTGFLVDEIPVAEDREGFISNLHYDPITAQFDFQYLPHVPELTSEERIEAIEQSQIEQDEAIMILTLGGM